MHEWNGLAQIELANELHARGNAMTRNGNQSGIGQLGTVVLTIYLLATPAFSQDIQIPAQDNESLVSN